jgi:hypothetical protein
VHHRQYIDEWHKYEQNVVRIFCMHTDRAFRTYLGLYHQASRIKLRQRWTDNDYADDGSSDDEDTIYDTRTQEGSHVEQGPVLDRVVCCLVTLFRFCNEMFLSFEISTVVGCSMPTICERDQECIGRTG